MKDCVFETNFSVLRGVFEQFNEAVRKSPTSWEKLEYSSWKNACGDVIEWCEIQKYTEE